MRFAQPVLLLCLLLLPWIVLRGRRARVSRAAIVLRGGAVTALVLAIAGLAVRSGSGPAAVVFVLDKSASVPQRRQAAALAGAAAHTQGMGTGDRAALVVFGGDAVVDQALGRRPLTGEAASRVAAGATDIGQGIRVARNLLPDDGTRHIVVMSDGVETTGDAAAEARAAAAAGIAVHAVPLQRDIRTMNARVTAVRAPSTVRTGEPFDIVLRVEGPAGASTEVEVRRGDSPLGRHRATFDASNAAIVAFQDRLDAPGAATYTAGARAASGESHIDAGAVVIAAARPALLYVDGGNAALRPVLDSAAYRIDTVQPAAVPVSKESLASYAAVILDDVIGDALADRQAQALAAYVDDGGGLLLRGSERTLDPAGYARSPFAAMLPVDLQRRRGSRAPDLALAVVFDKSGSMDDSVGELTKIELARRSVLAVQEVLQTGDSLGVIAFDAQPSVIAPLAAGHDAEDLRRRLRQITANGPTAIAPAVQMAYEWLRSSGSARRHVLLLSDGRSNADDAAKLLAVAQVPDVALSVVATGADVDRVFFRDLAARGRGRAFFPDDVRKLPEILAREAARASGGWRVRERFIARAPASHPILVGIDRARMASLDGYVAGAAKPGAEVPIESHLGDPLLAVWRHGLGRVAVFTGDVSASFERWSAYPRLWRQTIRWTGRSHDSSPLSAGLELRPRGAAIVVDAIDRDGRFITGFTGHAALATPSGLRQVELRQTAPGRYEAAFDTPSPGPYVAAVSLRDDAANEVTVHRGFYWMPPGETAAAANMTALGDIAANGGGRVLAEGENPFELERQPSYAEVSGLLALLGLVLFVVDIAVRRGVTFAAFRQLRRPTRSREAPAA